MKAKEGDIISWEFEELEYTAEVIIITKDNDYGIYITYDNYGFTQDYIPDKDVLRVWEPKHE